MGHYGLLHRIQLFRDRSQPPRNNQSTSTVNTHGAVRSAGGRRSPLTKAKTSHACRALFGPVDHDENLRFIKQELERGQKESQAKWNYDFRNDQPVNEPQQRYVWESMRACSRIHLPHISSIIPSSDVVERSVTFKNISSTQEASVPKESVQSGNRMQPFQRLPLDDIPDHPWVKSIVSRYSMCLMCTIVNFIV